MERKATEIIEKIESGYSIPPLSPIAIKLIELAADEKTSLYDMSMLIKEDPALTVRLLKLANSPFYRIPSEVSTIEEAVMRVGCNQIRLMALSISIRDTFPLIKHEQMDCEQFWKLSLYRGLIARVIALKLKNCDPDKAFVAGLLSEIGILIFFDLIIKDKDSNFVINLYPLENLLKEEEQKYGINHREIGEAALRFWKLPEQIVECQRIYPGSPYQNFTSLDKVCDIARQSSEFVFNKELDWGNFYEKAQREYNLNQEFISDIMVESFKVVELIAESMKIKINRDRDIEFLLAKAWESLRLISCRIEDMNQIKTPTFSTLKASGSQQIIIETLQAVAHQIRNPLTILGGFARRLEKILTPSSKEWSYVQQIIEESTRLEAVLSTMTTGKIY